MGFVSAGMVDRDEFTGKLLDPFQTFSEPLTLISLS